MGIQVEYNPDLALRNICMFKEGNREKEECIPEILEVGKEYPFLKKGQRLYYMLDDEPVPLIYTEGNSQLSRPIASIKIIESTHFRKNSEIWTKGKYKVIELFNLNDPTIHFEGFLRVKNNN
tara:strand:- start:121 stop:486 length:366 start_codon:yes stop_codon:yes gene_type:complete